MNCIHYAGSVTSEIPCAICREIDRLRAEIAAQRAEIQLLAKGNPEAAELVIVRIAVMLDAIDDEGTWPEKAEMAVGAFVEELKQARAEIAAKDALLKQSRDFMRQLPMKDGRTVGQWQDDALAAEGEK